ncbi:MAG: DUF3131 domain-containing protein [Methylococcaceae bacterium]|nr:DUF3131 domain-containing protein [Methylococcaceae bacterium]
MNLPALIYAIGAAIFLMPQLDALAQSERPRHDLAVFQGLLTDPLASQWQTLVDNKPGEAIRLNIETIARDGDRHDVLRLQYRIPPTAPGADASHVLEARLALNGLDASGYDHLSLLIKGDESVGFSPRLEVGFRNLNPIRPGLEIVGRAEVAQIGDHWTRVNIPLHQMQGIVDWHHLTDFHIVLVSSKLHVSEGAYFIDDIALVKTGDPGPAADDPVATREKDGWERAHGGPLAARHALRERLAGWPNQILVDGKTLPADDDAFLRRLAFDTWRGIDAFTDREHGLPLDRVHLAADSVAVERSFIGDYTSTTNIGFHLLAVTAARELGMIGRDEALRRLQDTLASLQKLETHEGFYFNYYNTTTLERTSNFVSFVDSSWLTAGLMTVRQAFPELADRIAPLLDRGDYRFFYDPQWKLMSHGYYVNLGQRATYHYGSLYSEARLGSLIAIGRGEIPEEHWFAMARTFPPEFSWQSRQPAERREKNERGFHWTGGYYRWREYRYVPSWGGSLFEALMPALLLDEALHAPLSLGRNDQVHSEIQRRYALEDLRYPVWGMSPSSEPGSERYAEYGIPFLGSLGYKDGAVTPHASALALLTEPAEALANLRQLAERYPVYGEFGFYDAVAPKSGTVAYHYLCLNQAMILVALADHLADHALQKHFANDPAIRKILTLIGFENFLD